MTAPTIKRIGKYEVIDLLGRGGMGLVYRAFDRQLNREVAIKTVTEGFTGDQEMLQRFYREAAKTGALKHPNIVIVYDLGEQDGFPYIVMEYLSGDPLDRVIQSNQSHPLAFKLHIIEQVCYALGYAHRNDVIHRDVKPANVIVQPDGVVKLLDFGIARQEKTDGHLTRTGHVIGTLQYMAPERLKNAAFDGRSDIFSVGVMLFQLLTGQLPFSGDYSIVQKILTEKHPPLRQFLEQYPPALDSIIDRAMAKNPDDRYTTADEMAAEIATIEQELKKEQVSEWMQRAERLVKEEQYTTAREVLLKLLKVESQHTAARQLIAQVQHSLTMRQKAEQIRQLRTLAEQAVNDKHYDEAIDYLQQASGLDPTSADLPGLLESVRQKKRRRERIDSYLREADVARDHGDLDQAGAVIAKAIEVDSEDSRVRAAHVALARLIEEANRQATAKKFLENARKDINARNFTAAIEALGEVERVDPSNPELISLQATAKAGREQNQRRRVLEQLQNEVALASTTEELNRVGKMVDEALGRMPTEPILMKLKSHVARHLHEQEIRQRVDQTVLRCRGLLESAPEDALKLVSDALRDAPGNERLLALQNTINTHIAERRQEQARAQYLTRAHDALTNGRYTDALRLLEACQKEGLSSPEISELIDFARQEADRRAKNAQIQTTLRQAQELMAQGSYKAVVDLLTPLQADQGASSLHFILEDARNRVRALQLDIESALKAAEALRRHELYAEAIKFLESQPAPILQSEPVKKFLAGLRASHEAERAGLRAVGAAYAALERLDLAASHLPDPGSGEATLVSRISPVFQSRRKSLADRQLSMVISQAQITLEAGNKKQAGRMLQEAAGLTEFASIGLQNEWHDLQKKLGKSKIFGKSGSK
ncbi:MAG TPA: protein kinase [Candidatus Sulfotelmatobacter sp.]|nr:protein kinase [Candidatus Sulfotelmatobacter sp.]